MERTGFSALCWRARSLEHGGVSVTVRRAVPRDAGAIGAVHVAGWRSAYAGILPDHSLTRLSAAQQAAQYDRDIRAGRAVFVAAEDDLVVGFTTVGRPRTAGLGDGEVETLYVLDDYRDQGVGRRLLQAGAGHLAAQGCASLFLWVLRDNHSRWFYERLGGRIARVGTTPVGGVAVAQVAYVWPSVAALSGEATIG